MDEQSAEALIQQVQELLAQSERGVSMPRCSACRYWVQDAEDGHRPCWGDCLRPGTTPPPGFVVLGADDGAARLVTAPTHGCANWES